MIRPDPALYYSAPPSHGEEYALAPTPVLVLSLPTPIQSTLQWLLYDQRKSSLGLWSFNQNHPSLRCKWSPVSLYSQGSPGNTIDPPSLLTVKGHYRRHVSPYSQGSPGNTIEALSLLTVKSHREILYKYSLGWFMGPLWSHTCFAGSIHTLLVQYALSWIHTHLPPFSA